MQIAAARRAWPSLRATFLRTQHRTSYRWYKGWVDVDGAEYERYNGVLRSLAGGDERCGGVHVLDLATMMNCTRERSIGGCGKETGWTTDGLHPPLWAARSYFSLALNVMADYGEACA